MLYNRLILFHYGWTEGEIFGVRLATARLDCIPRNVGTRLQINEIYTFFRVITLQKSVDFVLQEKSFAFQKRYRLNHSRSCLQTNRWSWNLLEWEPRLGKHPCRGLCGTMDRRFEVSGLRRMDVEYPRPR